MPDRSYAAKYLVAGCAMDGHTPYPNTRVVEPNSAIELANGTYRSRAYLFGPVEATPQETPLAIKSAKLAELLVGAV